jgi:hypothetical protein
MDKEGLLGVKLEGMWDIIECKLFKGMFIASRVRFSALPDSFRSSGSGTGSTQPREDN